MSVMAKIRNNFAHNLIIDFNSPDKEFQKQMGKLDLHTRYKHYPNLLGTRDAVRKPTTKRGQFVTNMRIMMSLMLNDTQLHRPYTNIPIGM